MRTHDLALAVALLAGSQGCKSDTERKADHAADFANATDRELTRARDELGRKQIASVDSAEHLTERSLQAASAEQDFEMRRDLFVRALRARYDVMANQVPMISALAAAMPLTDVGRTGVIEKQAVLQIRLDAAGRAIDELALTPSTSWDKRADEVTALVKHVDQARGDTWSALLAAPRLGGAS